MKPNRQELRNILYSPIPHVDRVRKAKQWLRDSDKELQQLKQNLLNPDGTIKHTNCCDMTTIELINEFLGENQQSEPEEPDKRSTFDR